MLIPLLISSLLSATSLVLIPEDDIDHGGHLERSYAVPLRSSSIHPDTQPLQKSCPITGVRHSSTVMHPSYVTMGTLPLATIVGVSDFDSIGTTETLVLGRNVSVGSNITDSQPFSQEEIGSPCDKRFPAPSPTSVIDEWVTESLYNSIKKKTAEDDACKALKSMAANGNCLANVAIAVLYKEGHTDFGVTEGEVEGVISTILPTFFRYQASCPALFALWHSRLTSHALIRE